METSVRIKASELDLDLLKKLKSLFGKDREITLTISSTEHPGTARESKKAYFARLGKALKNIEKGRGVGMTEVELDALVLERLKG